MITSNIQLRTNNKDHNFHSTIFFKAKKTQVLFRCLRLIIDLFYLLPVRGPRGAQGSAPQSQRHDQQRKPTVW